MDRPSIPPSSRAPGEPRKPDLLALAVLTVFKAVVSTLILAGGFRALSDDDYARVVIAQTFAEAPRLDPSGTSWLPVPFYTYGGVMLLFGRSLAVARATAFVLGVLATLLVYVAARWIGSERRPALLGAAIAGVLPYAAWLGVATVPDGITAALIVVGAASLSQAGWRRALGGLALTAAALSRYEAWPAAAVFALITLYDARRLDERRWHMGAAGLALLGPLAWLIHGVVSHGDALFFVSRVAAYRRAVGGGSASLLERLFGFPVAVLRAEPELMSVCLILVLLALGRIRRVFFARYRRVGWVLLAVLVFLVAGDLRDGAPTHHAERAVLSIWLGAALLAADLGWALYRRTPRRPRRVAVASLLAVLLGAATILRPWYARRDSFIDRRAEIDIGQSAARLMPAKETLLIDSADFGFYAVIAGFGSPSRAAPFDDRDPRKTRARDALASSDALQERLNASRTSWCVLREEKAGVAGHYLQRRAANDEFVLLQRRALNVIR